MTSVVRHLHTIPADVPFLGRLADGLVEMAGGLTPELARMIVLLPTRRACRSLRDTFLKLSGGLPVLLPRLRPLGDIDQDELEMQLAGLCGSAAMTSVPPAIPSVKRLFLLMELIGKWRPALIPDQRLQLAKALAILLDQVHTEDLDYTRLHTLVPAELAAHWQLTLEFLSIVTAAWPKILAQEGEIDPADRRNQLTKLLAKTWDQHPPEIPVIAAGSTGSIPATAALLDVVSRMEKGHVILPGLDTGLDDETWNALPDTHPQATMRLLLSRLDVSRRDIKIWGETPLPPTPRLVLARTLMHPSHRIETWATIDSKEKHVLQAGLRDLDLIEAPTQAEEALTIAIAMRETLHNPGATATLVTPDRTLARRVSAALRQWNVQVDDSAGTSLEATAAGQLASTILACVLEDFSPLRLLDLLRHPLNYTLGSRAPTDDLDRLVFRGLRPPGGLAGLIEKADRLNPARPKLGDLLRHIEKMFAPLTSLNAAPRPFSLFATTLAQLCETLAGGGDYLWGRGDGEALAGLLSSLQQDTKTADPVTLEEFSRILRHLMKLGSVRPGYGGHSRLTILGQLEARMVESDLMILGGLNEGSWPADPANDPWMSRPMRRDFGLPSPERSIGLSAHDFVQALCHRRVLLTRSLKNGGVQTVPSRWLQRFTTLREAAGLSLTPGNPYLEWARIRNCASATPVPARPPRPCPPVESRPQALSATSVEKLLRNPYHIYAVKILRLRPLAPIDQDDYSAERGSLVHATLREFIDLTRDKLPPDALALLTSMAREKAKERGLSGPQWEYWAARLERGLDWFIKNEMAWRQRGTPYLLEATGHCLLPLEDGTFFTLRATADRIDRLIAGGVAIIDYKTGALPTVAAMRRGTESQLLLEAVIMTHGGFGERQKVGEISHWHISGGRQAGEVRSVDLSEQGKNGDQINLAEQGLIRIASNFRRYETPYLALPPAGIPFAEEKAIAHLARLMEWSSLDTEDEEDAHE